MYSQALRDARRTRKLSQPQVAEICFLSESHYPRIEAGTHDPQPETTLHLAKGLRRYDLIQHHCKTKCPIGQQLGYYKLNNIDDSLVGILTKLEAEHREAGEVLDILKNTALNKRARESFSDLEWQQFIQAVHELLDVEHVIVELKLALMNLTDVAQEVEEHNRKCLEKGYIKKEPALRVQA